MPIDSLMTVTSRSAGSEIFLTDSVGNRVVLARNRDAILNLVRVFSTDEDSAIDASIEGWFDIPIATCEDCGEAGRLRCGSCSAEDTRGAVDFATFGDPQGGAPDAA